MRHLSVLLFFGLTAVAANARATTCPVAPQDLALARLVAQSSIVVSGFTEVDSEHIQAGAYLNVPVRQGDLLKGELPSDPLNIRVYSKDVAYAPSMSAVQLATNERSLMFLIHFDAGGTTGFYFAGYSPAALRPADPASLLAVKTEIDRQAAILGQWTPDSRLAAYAEVQKLIADLAAVSPKDPAARDKQARIFLALEQLGSAAVPAIVAQMDDRRPLARHEISLQNKAADAFEAYRHYSPELIVDGLAAVLNQITSEKYGDLFNGGSARERDAAVAGWRIYATDLVCQHKAS